MLAILFSSVLYKAYNWEPFTASVLFSPIKPAATFCNLLSLPTSPTVNIPLVLVPANVWPLKSFCISCNWYSSSPKVVSDLATYLESLPKYTELSWSAFILLPKTTEFDAVNVLLLPKRYEF